MLKKIWCVAFSPNTFIATLAYGAVRSVHLWHLFCMQSNAIFHFYCSLYYIISDELIEFHHLLLFCCQHLPAAQQFGKHWHLQMHFTTAVYKILYWAKLWYRTIWNIIIPEFVRASLIYTKVIWIRPKYTTCPIECVQFVLEVFTVDPGPVRVRVYIFNGQPGSGRVLGIFNFVCNTGVDRRKPPPLQRSASVSVCVCNLQFVKLGWKSVSGK